MKARTIIALGVLELALGLGITGNMIINSDRYKATPEEIKRSQKFVEDAGLRENLFYPIHESFSNFNPYVMPLSMASGLIIACGCSTLGTGLNRRKREQNNY